MSSICLSGYTSVTCELGFFGVTEPQFTALLQEHAGFNWAGQSPATTGLLDLLFNICMVLCLAVMDQPAWVVSKAYLKTANQSDEAVQVCHVTCICSALLNHMLVDNKVQPGCTA